MLAPTRSDTHHSAWISTARLPRADHGRSSPLGDERAASIQVAVSPCVRNPSKSTW
jgi:hypothetical protein